MLKKNRISSCTIDRFKSIKRDCRKADKNFTSKNTDQQDVKTLFSTHIKIWGIHYGIIYRLTDTANYKVYIGQTIQTLRDRFQQHFKAPPNKYLAQAFFRYKKNFKIVENGIINNTMSYRTKGGEFTIEVIEYCADVFSINKAEIRSIEIYKSWIKKYGIKYGYNLNRGGGDSGIPKEGQKREDHWRWIYIDIELLIELTQKGLLLDEIAREFGTSTPTIERRFHDLDNRYGVKNITKARELFGGTEQASIRRGIRNRMSHPNYKIVLDEDVIGQIKLLKTKKEIQEALGIGRIQLMKKLNEMGYNDLDEIRKDLGMYKDFKKQWAERVSDHLTNDINIGDFVNAICKGLNKEELMDKFDVGEIQLYNKLKEIGYNSLPKARNALGGEIFFQIRRYIKTSGNVLQALFELSKIHQSFTAKKLGDIVNITEKGGYYHISKKLIPFGLVEEISTKEYLVKYNYRLTEYGKEFLRKNFS